MLKTASDFDNSINFIISGMTEEQNKGLLYQLKTLNSDDFNSTFEVIESRLNHLYEKIRTMEDVIKYARTYIEQEIYNTSNECRVIMNSLEENRDSIKSSAYITYDVPMLEGTGLYLDRDSTELARCNVKNNTLTLSGKNQAILPIKSIERKRGQIPYKSNLENLINGDKYRAFYLLDGPVINGLREDIYIEFNAPTAVNFIDIETSKCAIDNILYITDTNNIEHDDKFVSIISRERKIKAIQITLSSKSYKTSKYYIDQTRMNSNFWNRVKDIEYDRAQGFKSDISDLDVLAGIDSFKAAYTNYVSELQSWKQQRASVASANSQNGYADVVPYTDYVMAPTNLTSNTTINRSPFNADPIPSAEQNIKYTRGGEQ